MRLTRYTDYAMRTLLYVAAHNDRLCSISQIAGAYGISKSNIMKVVSDLAEAGYLDTVRGRHGGVRLARPANAINVGGVIRHTEEDFDLADCGSCIIAAGCGVRGALGKAVEAFLMVLDEYSLADLNRDSDAVRALFIPAGKPQSSLDRSEQDPCP
jgi:Rrf2 family nitric oxide-sensitive transcriptional repressor